VCVCVCVCVCRRDQELFLQDLEEDPEMRSQINLYRDADYDTVSESDVEDEGFPEVRVEELLDDFSGMALE
jgi:nonsense-mediated mRNA decay protein 3